MTVIPGDCRDVMATMDAHSVDAIVTDFPRKFGLFGTMESYNREAGTVLETPPGVTPKGLASMCINDTPALKLDAISELAAGTAGEHLVCADLLISGFRAFIADQNCPYDVVVDVGDRIVRVQVKTTKYQRSIPQRASHIPAYMWHVRRAGKGGQRLYGEGEFDVLALVALDIRRIAYMPPSLLKQTVHLRPPHADPNTGKHFEQFPFDRALRELGVTHA